MKAPHYEPGGKRSPQQSAEVIELRLLELKQLFNSLDPSPFRERDLNSEAADFILGWAKETPRNKPLSLRLHLEQIGAPDEPETLAVAIHDYFKSRAGASRLQLRHLFRRGRISLMIGLLFLGGCVVLSDLAERRFGGWRFLRLLQESLFIGGWVAMWRPLEVFLYDWWPILAEARMNDRLSNMPVKIVYTGRGVDV